MKLLISLGTAQDKLSLSAEVWNKGDRCVVKVEKEFFVGTITSAGPKKLGIVFDDGVKGSATLPDRAIRKIVSKKVMKRPIDKVKADALVKDAKEAAKAPAAAPVKKAAKVASPAKTPVVTQPAPAIKPTTSNTPTAKKASSTDESKHELFDLIVGAGFAKTEAKRIISGEGINKTGDKAFSSAYKLMAKVDTAGWKENKSKIQRSGWDGVRDHYFDKGSETLYLKVNDMVKNVTVEIRLIKGAT